MALRHRLFGAPPSDDPVGHRDTQQKQNSGPGEAANGRRHGKKMNVLLVFGTPGLCFLYTGDASRVSRQGDALNLDINALGQLLHGDAAPGGLVNEPLGILLVHALQEAMSVYCTVNKSGRACPHGEVGHVGQEGIDLDHLLDGRAGLLEDSLEVGNASGSLLLDGALDQVALGIAGNLARAVDGGGGLDGLGLLIGSEQSQTDRLAMSTTSRGRACVRT